MKYLIGNHRYYQNETIHLIDDQNICLRCGAKIQDFSLADNYVTNLNDEIFVLNIVPGTKRCLQKEVNIIEGIYG